MPAPIRWQFLSLWVAVVAQTASLVTIHAVALRELLGTAGGFQPATLAAWLGLAALPSLLLAPLIGSLIATSRTGLVMSSALAIGLGAILLKAFGDAPTLSVAALLTLASTFFFAGVVQLASTIGWRLYTFCELLVIAAALGSIIGITLAIASPQPDRVAMLLTFLAWFATANGRFGPLASLSLKQGLVKPFASAFRDALKHRLSRNALIGICLWVFTCMTLLVVLPHFELPISFEQHEFSLACAMMAGAVAAGWLRHPYRSGYTISYGAVLLFACLLRLRFSDSGNLPFLGMGFALGWMLPALLHFYLGWTTPHGTATGPLMASASLGALGVAGLLFALNGEADPRTLAFNVLLVVSGIATLAAFIGFFRPALEATTELIIWPLYRFRPVGDHKQLPVRGPCLVIANHAAWLDPLFVAKIVRGPIIPMMTSKFYDLPVIAFFMRRVIGTIRVPESSYRHEAPELKEAIAALDRRDIVALFPEGYLRRKEEIPLRRFGQGIAKILAERPTTPVFACWIDGNWGSFFSHRFGPPTKKKRLDFWRPIRIGVVGPIAVDPAILENQMAVRTFLMERMLAARDLLNLEPIAFNLPVEGEKE